MEYFLTYLKSIGLVAKDLETKKEKTELSSYLKSMLEFDPKQVLEIMLESDVVIEVENPEIFKKYFSLGEKFNNLPSFCFEGIEVRLRAFQVAEKPYIVFSKIKRMFVLEEIIESKLQEIYKERGISEEEIQLKEMFEPGELGQRIIGEVEELYRTFFLDAAQTDNKRRISKEMTEALEKQIQKMKNVE